MGCSPRANAHWSGSHTRVAFGRDSFEFIVFLSKFADFIVFIKTLKTAQVSLLRTAFNKHVINDLLVTSHSMTRCQLVIDRGGVSVQKT